VLQRGHRDVVDMIFDLQGYGFLQEVAFGLLRLTGRWLKLSHHESRRGLSFCVFSSDSLIIRSTENWILVTVAMQHNQGKMLPV
jgi:hypothetical protein